MRADTFQFTASDGASLFVHRFLPEGPARAVVQVAHGMAEHGARYARFAEALCARGYAVYADDHRGHGQTSPSEADRGWVQREDGWERLVLDQAELIARHKQEHPGLKVVFFGHSMGSFLGQTYLLERSVEVAAAILSGSSGRPGLLAQAGRLVARLERLRLGERGRSALLTALSFGDFNKQFSPNRTAFDWLSRDEKEVDKYVADPACGFPVTTTLWVDLLDAAARNAEPAFQANVRKDLPVYLVAGALDPVGEKGAGVRRLEAEYKRAGLASVTCVLYPQARHEILNETNREEVTAGILAWLEGLKL
jgi:alpha-beta hydrolase superfamily lysophospholipase